MPELPYDLNALEPILSKDQVDYHYNKHTKKYYDTCQELIEGTSFQKKFTDLYQLIRSPNFIHSDTKLYHNACQAWNHSFYWETLCPQKQSNEIQEPLLKAIKNDFGTVEKFKKTLIEQGVNFFGSGWIWVYVEGEVVRIKTSPNSSNPLSNAKQEPIIAIDLWEHAYLYDSQYVADRKSYLENIWNIINWVVVTKRFEQANKGD